MEAKRRNDTQTWHFFSVFVFKHNLDMHGMGVHAVGVHGVGVHGMGAHGMGGHDVGVRCSHLPLFKVVLSKFAISYFHQEEGMKFPKSIGGH